MTTEYYIGVMSGTSLDGADIVVVDFNENISVIAQCNVPYPEDLYQKILSLRTTQNIRVIASLDVLLGKFFAEAILNFLNDSNIDPDKIIAIGLHGQTIDHQVDIEPFYSVQIGDANQVSFLTNITTVADFRRKDMAAGGQGAPLVPAFHQAAFMGLKKNICIVNIGGIANITYIPQHGKIIGFDTGPGNGLLDNWIQLHLGHKFDMSGLWGEKGQVDENILEAMLADSYFHKKYPKSTGREYFNMSWLDSFDLSLKKPIDIQATLCELTAKSICDSILKFDVDEIIVCGGGVRNLDLISRLARISKLEVSTTNKYGLDSDMLEAMAFAWLARQTINMQAGNLPSVTGASQALTLGGVYYAQT